HARADLERAAGMIGVHVNLQRLRISDDEQRVTKLQQFVFDRLAVELVSLDHEGRAVPVLRELLVDGVGAQLLTFSGSLRKWLAGDRGGETAHDLQQTRAACVDDSGLAKHGEL